MSLLQIKLVALAGCFSVGLAVSASAVAGERSFFNNIEGQWSGGGNIVAGKYKGTKFFCNFKGTTPGRRLGMTVDGTCRVGIFNQQVSATFVKSGRSYRGQFLDGAKGKGMDVVSGRLSRQKLIVGFNRKKLNGAMVANMRNPNTMRVTISVRVDGQLIPVIGMSLNKKKTSATQSTALRGSGTDN